MDFPIPPEFWWSTDNLSASFFRQGVDQKILPCGQGRIDSIKINPSLLMMTDCHMLPLTGLIASAYTGLNVQKWDGLGVDMGWEWIWVGSGYGMEVSERTSAKSTDLRC